jgi:D-glycero-D-manno-heptose 1,7-bisphosphate phosphatase
MKLIILDRDGVINEDSDDYIKSPEEWVPIPGSLEAIARLNLAGYQVVVLTNQSGIGRGLFDMHALNAIHQKMYQHLNIVGGNIDAIFFCPHTPDDQCNCRKPAAGLFQQLEKRLNIKLQGIPAVGDSLRDIQSARTAGASPVLVRTGKGERTLADGEDLQGVPVYANLAEYVNQLLMEE